MPEMSISENSKRFDEYSFKKKVENTSPVFYHYNHPKDFNYLEKHKNYNVRINSYNLIFLKSTIGTGKRLGFLNQRQ